MNTKSETYQTIEEFIAGRPVKEIIEKLAEADEARTSFARDDDMAMSAEADSAYQIIHKVLGQVTHANYRLEKLRCPVNVYEHERKQVIKRNSEFEKKGLCTHSVGVGLSCGHQCTYCSTPAMMRTQKFFDIHELTSFIPGNAIIDPETARRIEENIPRNLTAEDVIQVSTADDAWSPEAQRYRMGRQIMKVLLEKTPAQIRVLTKNADVADDFDLFEQYSDRIILGLSTGIPSDREDCARVIEPNASSIKDRLATMKKAQDLGMRTYGMLCPCLPLIADTDEALNRMFDDVIERGAEDIWLEPVNARGKALINTENALIRYGLNAEAAAVNAIRTKTVWSQYTFDLIEKSIAIAESKGVVEGLHILLYPAGLTDEHKEQLKTIPQGIVWLG